MTEVIVITGMGAVSPHWALRWARSGRSLIAGKSAFSPPLDPL